LKRPLDIPGPFGRTKLRYALRSGARDTATVMRVIGVLFLAGAALVGFSVLLPHPEVADTRALCAIAGLAAIVGGASLVWADRARIGIAHAVLAAGTWLVSLCVYFSGVASGLYSPMFVWVVLLAASFFSRRAVAAHLAWVVASWGVTLALVDELTGFSAITRWTLGSFVFVITAMVMSEIVIGRKSTEEQLSSAAHLANHDPLTGLANRRLLGETLGRELARARRHGTPLALVALDLDKFKAYNDERGHAAGDQLLRTASRGWVHALRAEDLIARVGGDEFVALLPDCPVAQADRTAERLRRNLPRGCACSVGVANWDRAESAERLLARADVSLYRAKDQKQPDASER